MNSHTRRKFLKNSMLAAAALSVPVRCWAQSRGANDAIRIAVVGFNGRGKDHIDGFRKLPDVRIVALCDVDENVLDAAAQKFEEDNQSVRKFTDVRELLAQKDIDAISIATPNHWHSLIGIWACQAGKDVYVEKPVSHNVWEGRQFVRAARSHRRIVQTGTQCRSSAGLAEAIHWLHEGNLGKIRVARGLCYKARPSIGKVEGPQPIPSGIHYDLWCGPAPKDPLLRKKLHYDWHWVWPTGNGDLGNQGIHQMDIARWVLQEQALSPRVFGVGGRFGYEDDGRTPNTLMVYHDYERAPLIFEVRGLPTQDFKGAKVGVTVECEGGNLVIPTYSKAIAYDSQGKIIKTWDRGGDHFANFIKAMRSRNPNDLSAEILEGHLSSALCHTGNISYLIGSQMAPEAIREQIKSDRECAPTFERMAEHLAENTVDIEKDRPTLGMILRMRPESELFIDQFKANSLLTRRYREPFVVPDKV